MKAFSIFSLSITLSLLSSLVSAQGLSMDRNQNIVGSVIHRTDISAYFRCNDVLSDREFVQNAYNVLFNMSNALSVPPPQNANCVVSQSRVLGNNISLEFFVSRTNERCFYANFCNDSRTLTFFPNQNGSLSYLFTVSNADRGLTEFWCFSPELGGIVEEHCGSL